MLALFLMLLTFGGISQRPADNVFSYKIKPIPQVDRTNLEISLRFQANDTNPLKIKMPSDCFGMPDLDKYVTSFEAENGTSIKAGDKATEKTVQPNSDGMVTLRYTLSFDPKVMDNYPYSPNTSAEHFHLAGCQFILPIGDDNQKRRYQFEMTDVPKNWQIYSTKSTNPAKYEVEASYDDLSFSAIGGGKNAHFFQTKKGRVAVFAHGDFAIGREKIYSSIEQIIRTERAWFDDYNQPNFMIVVAPRSNFSSGYATENAFICFVDRQTTNEDLSLLVAHEFFHNWLPDKIEIIQDKKYADFRYEWFSEGFTDYFSRKILAEAKLFSQESFVKAVNQNIYDIADNPNRNKSYAELLELAKSGKFDGVAKKLAYFRGALIALNWDAQIKRANKKRDLSDFIRQLFQLASKTDGKISESAFFDFAKSYGIDAKNDLERYIMRGETIVPEKDALGKTYQLSEIEKPSFEVGFSLEQTKKTGKISSLKENSPAFQAGLREGMEFVGVQNAYRFSNSWKADLPLVVKVKINNEERSFSYFPNGVKMRLPFFQSKK